MLQASLVEQRAPLAQVDKHVEIAVRTCVTSGDGPENLDTVPAR